MSVGYLVLEDGSVFRGRSVAADGVAFGEAVFTTAMTGYQETLTDPSYAEQLVCFTAPMVGNYGVDSARSESSRPHARAVLMREARGPEWTDWLHERGIVALSGIDTRSLVLRLRAGGAMRAVAVAGAQVGQRRGGNRGGAGDVRPRGRDDPGREGRRVEAVLRAQDEVGIECAGRGRIGRPARELLEKAPGEIERFAGRDGLET